MHRIIDSVSVFGLFGLLFNNSVSAGPVAETGKKKKVVKDLEINKASNILMKLQLVLLKLSKLNKKML